MPDTVPADAGYRSSSPAMPFQHLPDAVPAPAGYRSSTCRIPFQHLHYPQAKTEKTVAQQRLTSGPIFA
jgi:hypothetical protein